MNSKKKPETAVPKTTAWGGSAKWYDQHQGEQGGYYHEKLIIPRSLKLLSLEKSSPSTLLDVGCGQGVLARHLPDFCSYVGIDLSHELLKLARRYKNSCPAQFVRCDAAQYSCKAGSFSHIISILSLQNMENPVKVVENCSHALSKTGKWLVVLNHPCFRIPRHSSWEFDPEHRVQSRKINSYMTPQTISMQVHPSMGETSPVTKNFHHPISDILSWFFRSGFSLVQMEEWCSDKKSTGKYAEQEDRARQEFPLFMTLVFERK